MSDDDSDLEDFDYELTDDDFEHDTFYPSKSDILAIHDDIVAEDEDAEEGIFSDGEGKIEFLLNQIQGVIMGAEPETIHEKGLLLLQRIASSHPFVDGNKRTALNATWTFYALNGHYFDYGEEVKAWLKLFAVNEDLVDQEASLEHFREITHSADTDRAPHHLAELMHLQKWRSEFTTEELDIDGSFTEGDMETFVALFAERYNLTVKLVAFRDKYQDSLPDEFIEVVDQDEEGLNEALDMIIDGVEEDHLEHLRAESVDEFTELMEEIRPGNAKEHI